MIPSHHCPRWFALSVACVLVLGCLRAAEAAAAKRYVVSEFGAVGDGTTLNTAAIQKAIDAASAGGGGVVVVPTGKFLSGSIFLKAGTELHLDEGAVLFGSSNIEDYPKRETRIEGHFEPWRMALVNAQQLDRVRISGPGVLDGNGVTYWQAFWKRRQENPRCTNLEVERPRLLFIDRCSDVRVENMALQDSGFWNLHLYRCRGVTIDGVRITIPSAKNGLRGPSTDGIDVDSSQDVTIRHCYISTNDDNIALKGSKGPFADKDTDSPPVENITVEDVECGEGNGLITCGSEATLVRNVTVRNCKMSGRATLLTLKLRPDTPQHYEHITMDNITLAGGGRLINCAPWTQFFDLKGQKPPTRQVNDITLRNIKGEYGSFGTLRGNPANAEHGTPADVLKDITLENIDVKFTATQPNADKPNLGAIENLVVKNVMVNGKAYAP